MVATKTPSRPHLVNTSSKSAFGNFYSRLFAPIDNASLVYFRIAFGALMLWEVMQYFSKGWIKQFYIDAKLHFTFYGFSWVRPWPGDGMYLHFFALGVLSFFILIGLGYRISCLLFLIGFTYVFLIEQSYYLNHFYLIILVSFLLIFLPANRAYSIDALRRPAIRSDTAPAWALWSLRAQMAIVYIYGAFAKINPDWLRGEPLRIWLAPHTDFPIIGHLFTRDWMPYLFAYSGLLIDLLAVPFLLWRKSRPIAFTIVVLFHVMNSRLFGIGVFPWFSIAMTLLFFPPHWPRLLRFWKAVERPRPTSEPELHHPVPARHAGVVLFALYFALQLLIPFRHFLYAGNVHWTEEGHKFSWHMMLREKQGTARLFATDPATNTTWEINPREYLNPRQLRKMSVLPHLTLQFAHRVASEQRAKGHKKVEIRARAFVSLNNRRRQLLINPKVDLASIPQMTPAREWILPLQGTDYYSNAASLNPEKLNPRPRVLLDYEHHPGPSPGYDFQAGYGHPVSSPTNGVVHLAGTNPRTGDSVLLIQSDLGHFIHMSCNDTIYVRAGQRVSTKTIIANEGINCDSRGVSYTHIHTILPVVATLFEDPKRITRSAHGMTYRLTDPDDLSATGYLPTSVYGGRDDIDGLVKRAKEKYFALGDKYPRTFAGWFINASKEAENSRFFPKLTVSYVMLKNGFVNDAKLGDALLKYMKWYIDLSPGLVLPYPNPKFSKEYRMPRKDRDRPKKLKGIWALHLKNVKNGNWKESISKIEEFKRLAPFASFVGETFIENDLGHAYMELGLSQLEENDLPISKEYLKRAAVHSLISDAITRYRPLSRGMRSEFYTTTYKQLGIVLEKLGWKEEARFFEKEHRKWRVVLEDENRGS